MTAATPAPATLSRRNPTLPAAALALVLLVAVPTAVALALGAAPYEAVAGMFPGTAVAITTTLLRTLADVAALVSIGALVHLLFLREATSREAFDLDDSPELPILRRASGLWLLAAMGLMLFAPLDSSGVRLGQLFLPGMLAYVQAATYAPGALFISFLGAAIVAVGAHQARHWTGLLLPLLGAIWAALAPIAVGHVLVGPGHDLAGDAAVIQAFAAYPLFGALAVLALAHGRVGEMPAGTLRRLRAVALVALPLIAATEAVVSLVLLAGTDPVAGPAGRLMIARWALLALLAVVTLAATRRPVEASRAAAPGWSAAGLCLVAALVAVTAALSRVPTPQYFVDTTVSQIFMGFDVLADPTWAVLFTNWRPNLLFLTIAAAAVTAYLIGLSKLVRRGDKWPVGRTVAWLLGWAVVVFATSSGFGRYSAPDFGVHMIVHMSLNMLAPLLLVLGGFLTLMLRATRPGADSQHNLHDWITWTMDWRPMRWLYNPILVFTLFIASYYGLYLSDLFGFMVRYHWAHQLMNLHFLLFGYLYYGLVIGVDRTPRQLPHLGRLGLIMAAMPFHGFFGVIIMGSKRIIAEDFYRYLDLPWMDLAGAQYMGGAVAWAGGEIPALIVVVALGIQWARQDAREARRIDRHIDSGRDTEFDDYNRMLARLAERDAANARREPRS